MPVHPPRFKSSSVLEKRLRRTLSADETLRIAAYTRALKARRTQQRIYKPRMELWDDGGNPLITAVFELPGMGPNEVSVDVVDGRLVISGERRQHARSQAYAAHGDIGAGDEDDNASGFVMGRSCVLRVRELKYGFFRRVVAVPAGCTTKDVEASMENGMLTVSWPRAPIQVFSNAPHADTLPSQDTLAVVSDAPRCSGSHSSRSM
ncbi:HSP20-like chaperone [Cerioporus squamosus]|nr:HSP20-like chaperone [Cerioporus squamosus]